MYKSTVLCDRTLEIITLADSLELDELEELMITQDASAMRASLGKPFEAAKDVSNRWIKIHWKDRFIGAMGIEEANCYHSQLHFFLLGKNRQVARAVVTGVILHERFKGKRCSTKVPASDEFTYMRNFLHNCECAYTSFTEDAVTYESSLYMNPSKFIRSFFTLPILDTIPDTSTEEKE